MGFHANGRIEIGVGKVEHLAERFHLPKPRASEDEAGEMFYFNYSDVRAWQRQYIEMYRGCHDNHSHVFCLDDIELVLHAKVLISIAEEYYSESQKHVWENELEGKQASKYMAKRAMEFRLVFG